MNEFEKIKKDILKYNPQARINSVKKAYELAKEAHKGQKRVSGEPYFSHCYGTAKILVLLKADSPTIAAALLHDAVEDSKLKIEKIRDKLGEEVASLVEGVTKIDKINFSDKEDYTSENLRKVLLATAKDIRVMFIRLADRLHNMKTLECFRPEKQKRIAQETLSIYAPIAHKLGMWNLKGDLEDLSLRYLEPEVYRFLANKINEKRAERENKTKMMIKLINEKLKEKNIDAMVYGRAKYFYSIYKKMKKRKVDFNEIYDLIAIRIITKTIPDCYAALGIIHELWHPLPKKFKDYISTPKANGYQSLHTVLAGPHGKILEVQIRTEAMHHYSEDGAAAHWRYHGTERDKKFEKRISWLKQLLDWKRSSKDAMDFVETLKIGLFQNEIVAFSPRGDPITLPEGSTPVDFAYEIHGNVGNSCSKALVNNNLVPLSHELKSGDIVEIITTKNAKPSRQWLNFVKTNKARNRVKNALNIKVGYDFKSARKRTEKEDLIDTIQIGGKKAPLRFSKCCDIKPFDEIIGIYTVEGKIAIHKMICPNVKNTPNKKKAKLSWVGKQKKQKTTSIILNLKDTVGVLAEVMDLLAKSKINIKNINTKQGKEKIVTVFLDVDNLDEITSKDLVKLMNSISNVVNVNLIEK